MIFKYNINVIFQMGQSQTQLKQNQDYRLVEQLAVGNIVKHNKTESLHFLKQYSFTAQEAYQNALNSHSLRLANKNQHILNFLHFTTKSENSFCSSFHKIILIFQYSDYSLEKEIANRVRDSHPFSEKEVWSILCSCVLAAVHLIHCEGKMHCGLTSRDIRLSSNGCVKLLSHEMIGIDSHHSQNQGTPKSLAITLLECINMEKVTNQDVEYLQKMVEVLDCSREMKQMLYQMIKKNSSFLELQEHLFKLVQDDESLASHSNTPILKTQSPLVHSGYKCPPRIPQNNIRGRSEITTGKKQQKIEALVGDSEDLKSYLFMFEEINHQTQNPDQTEEESNFQQNVEVESPKQINSFFLKEKKNQSAATMKVDMKAMEKDISRKDYEINRVQSSRRNQNNQNQPPAQKTYEATSSQSNDGIFTDPKLISLIKNDIEQIRMRRSIGDLGKFKIQSNKNSTIQQETRSKNDSEKLTVQSQSKNQQNIFLGLKNLHQSKSTHEITSENWFKESQKMTSNNRIEPENMRNGFKQIEMIREVSQQYREEEDDKKSKKSIKSMGRQTEEQTKYENYKSDPIKTAQTGGRSQNIMNDNAMGFKKRKQSTAKFQNPRQDNNYKNQDNSASQSTLNYRPKQNPENYHHEQKSKTVGMKPVEAEKNLNTIRHQDFFHEYSQSQSSQSSSRLSSNRNQKQGKEKENLVQVSEKYTRGQYEGTKLNGKRHGFGTFFYSEGGKYVGSWRQNKMHGKGVLYYPSQKVAYDGEWQNDQLSGYGVLYNQEVAALRVPFDYRDWSDVEEYWVKYEGHFYQDNKEGQGKLYLVNGERLQAQFHEDKVDGEGILYRGDGTAVRGKWRQNKLIRMF